MSFFTELIKNKGEITAYNRFFIYNYAINPVPT